jgi:hypothetical protein
MTHGLNGDGRTAPPALKGGQERLVAIRPDLTGNTESDDALASISEHGKGQTAHVRLLLLLLLVIEGEEVISVEKLQFDDRVVTPSVSRSLLLIALSRSPPEEYLHEFFIRRLLKTDIIKPSQGQLRRRSVRTRILS